MKKILLLFLFVAVIIIGTFSICNASDTGINITEPDISISNRQFDFDIYLDGYRRSGYEADVYIATYDSEKRLLNVQKSEPDRDGYAFISLPITMKEKCYKVFAFDLNDELTPLCKSFGSELSYSDYNAVDIFIRNLYEIDTSRNRVEYYINPEESNKTASIKFSDNYTCKINGVLSDLLNIANLEDGLIRFYDGDLDGKFECIKANTYNYGFVDAVDTFEKTISIDGREVKLSSGNIELTSSSGLELPLSNFKVGDFVAVSSDGENFSEYEEYLQIVRLDKNIIHGFVESTWSFDGDHYVVVDGIEYITLVDLCAADEGTFYIDLTGRIIKFE